MSILLLFLWACIAGTLMSMTDWILRRKLNWDEYFATFIAFVVWFLLTSLVAIGLLP